VTRPAFRVAHITNADLSLRFLLLPQMRAMRDEGFDVTAVSPPGRWTPAIETEGIRHIPWLHSKRSWDPKADLKAFWELLGILQREQFDLVHTHHHKPGVLGRLAGRLAGNAYVVNTVHGLFAQPGDRLSKKLPVLGVESLAARFSDLELFQSREDLHWLRRLRVATGDSLLLGNGIDLSAFDPARVPADRTTALRTELGIPEDVPVVATVARLVAEKGFRELFAAAGGLRDHERRPCFLVVGGRDTVRPDALSSGDLEAAPARMTFAGWREDVRDLLSVVDVFVLPSRREGVPRAAIEAAAMAKPMVLTDIRGCREVARHGVEGLLVPPRDAAGLTAAIARLLNDPSLARRLGSAARARALEHFDERRVIETVIGGYRELLESNGLGTRG
jgi:glycosyltransferase involved in cell wall biosynthesis